MNQAHRRVFRRYWEWSDNIVAEMIRSGLYCSPLGWEYHVHPNVHEVSGPSFHMNALRNVAIQTTGADILRVAVIFADQLDLGMLATAHDAILVQLPLDRLPEQVLMMELCMQKAGELVLDGFRLKVKPDIRLPGERFLEERGERTFTIVNRFLENREYGVAYR
jgi:hypothetical protein